MGLFTPVLGTLRTLANWRALRCLVAQYCDSPASGTSSRAQVYERHLPDAFAALLDLPEGNQAHKGDEPIVYFYCLAHSGHAGFQGPSGDAFIAAQHVILDSSIPFEVVKVSLPGSCGDNAEAAGQSVQPAGHKGSEEKCHGVRSGRSDETANTEIAFEQAPPSQAVSADDLMSMSIL